MDGGSIASLAAKVKKFTEPIMALIA